jgi:uncharacterized membrane protein
MPQNPELLKLQTAELLKAVAPKFLELSYCFLSIVVVSLSIVAIFFIRKIEGSKLTDLLVIIVNGDALKILATLLIVGSATLLAVFGVLEESTVAAILSGVAGYVLGTYGKAKGRGQVDRTE